VLRPGRHFHFVSPKQRHTAKRIFERLRTEYGFAGGYTVVKDYVRLARVRSREVFVPLAHPPGHAQVDFGESIGVIGGVRLKLHVLCFDLPHSDACFVKAYPAETTEAFFNGHVSAFAFFGGIPLSILYDNLKIAVAWILGDGKRQRTRAFTELVSHYLFQGRFGRPGKGNDKGKVEALVKYSRVNFLTPAPDAPSFEALNAMLEERCRVRQNERAGRHEQTIGERLVADQAVLRRSSPAATSARPKSPRPRSCAIACTIIPCQRPMDCATGAGKTTVMAMLIAWQTINAERRQGSKYFTRGFLICARGLTIKGRLRVLHPNDPDSCYASR
jgi:transposase